MYNERRQVVSYPENPGNDPENADAATYINEILSSLLGPVNNKELKQSSVHRPLTPGDVVTLRSGGAAMTVEETNAARIGCVWMVDGNLFRNSFRPTLLKRYGQTSLQ